MDGIGRGPSTRTSGPGDSGTFCPGNLWQARPPTNLKIRRFSEGLFNLYDGLVRLSNAMPGLETLLAEIAAFPDGKHDDQVDVLSEGHLRARRCGLKLGRVVLPPAKVQIVSPKSRDQELYDRRQWGRG
jgi:hypothetical protein